MRRRMKCDMCDVRREALVGRSGSDLACNGPWSESESR